MNVQQGWIMRPARIRLVVVMLTVIWGLRGMAQTVVGPLAPPWRPIPEIPALLWFTDLDESSDEATKLFLNGDLITQDPSRPKGAPGTEIMWPPWQGDRYVLLKEMARTRTADRKVSWTIKLNTTPLRVPDGKFDPDRVFLRFNIWASEPGEVTVKVKAGTSLSGALTVPRPQRWSPLKISLGKLVGLGERMRPDALVQEIRFAFAPSRTGKELPCVCIDKVIVGHQMPAETVALMLMAWQARMSTLTRRVETDGFCYSDKMHQTMRKLMMRSRHRGPVLVFMPPTSDDPSRIFSDAAREVRMRGTGLEVPKDPRAFPFTEMEDIRAFLPYLLAQTDARSVLLVITAEEAVHLGKDVESLRVILDRLLAAHCLPILCLPGEEESNRKLTEVRQATVRLCHEMGVPYADQGHAFSQVSRPYIDGRLTVEGQKALSALLVTAYKHVYEASTGRR